jgi:hypothetical protein
MAYERHFMQFITERGKAERKKNTFEPGNRYDQAIVQASIIHKN